MYLWNFIEKCMCVSHFEKYCQIILQKSYTVHNSNNNMVLFPTVKHWGFSSILISVNLTGGIWQPVFVWWYTVEYLFMFTGCLQFFSSGLLRLSFIYWVIHLFSHLKNSMHIKAIRTLLWVYVKFFPNLLLVSKFCFIQRVPKECLYILRTEKPVLKLE